jgi:hypothetical protein
MPAHRNCCDEQQGSELDEPSVEKWPGKKSKKTTKTSTANSAGNSEQSRVKTSDHIAGSAFGIIFRRRFALCCENPGRTQVTMTCLRDN